MQKQPLNALRTLLAVLVFVCTLSSVFFTAHERFHACSGEDCPVCLVMQLSEQNLKLLSLLLLFCAAAAAAVFGCRRERLTAVPAVCRADTLVSRKIRLND